MCENRARLPKYRTTTSAAMSQSGSLAKRHVQTATWPATLAREEARRAALAPFMGISLSVDCGNAVTALAKQFACSFTPYIVCVHVGSRGRGRRKQLGATSPSWQSNEAADATYVMQMFSWRDFRQNNNTSIIDHATREEGLGAPHVAAHEGRICMPAAHARFEGR